MSHSAKIDLFNRYPINLGHPLASTLWDCRTFSDERAINLLDQKSVATGLGRVAAGGYKGLDFPGSGSDFFEISSAGHFDTYTKYVIASADAISQDNLISGSTANQHALWYNGTGLQAGHNGSWTHVTGTVSTGEIHRIAVTYDGDRMAMFLDGVLIDTATGITAPSGSGASQIGAYSGVALLNGQIFFTGVWDRALSDNDLLAFDANPQQILQIPRPTAKKYWLFPSVAGTTIDASLEPINITEFAASINAETAISAGLESITVTEAQASIVLGVTVAAALESIQVTELPASISAGNVIGANLETIDLTTFQAATSLDRTIAATLESLELTIFKADTSLNKTVAASLESINITENAATIQKGAITTLLEQLTITTYSATIVGEALIWTVQPGDASSWSAQADSSDVWIPQADDSSTWTP